MSLIHYEAGVFYAWIGGVLTVVPIVTSVGATYDERTITTTGNIDNLDIGDSPFVLLRMNNATEATLRGMIPGVVNQRVIVKSVGAGNVLQAHQHASSTDINRLKNWVTSGITPLKATLGVSEYIYDDTTNRWELLLHEQGAPIDIPYASGNFNGSGAMTWGVDSADQIQYNYYLKGARGIFTYVIGGSDVGGVANSDLQITLPNGYTAAGSCNGTGTTSDAGAATAVGLHILSTGVSTSRIRVLKNPVTNWTLTTGDNTVAAGQIDVPLN